MVGFLLFFSSFENVKDIGKRTFYILLEGFLCTFSLSRGIFSIITFSLLFLSFHAFWIYDVWTHEQLAAAVSNKPRERKKTPKEKHPLSPRIYTALPFENIYCHSFSSQSTFSDKYPFFCAKKHFYTHRKGLCIVKSRIDLKYFHSRTFGSFHIFRFSPPPPLHSLHTRNIFLLVQRRKFTVNKQRRELFVVWRRAKYRINKKRKSKTGKLWVINRIKEISESLESSLFWQQLKFKSTSATIIIIIHPSTFSTTQR